MENFSSSTLNTKKDCAVIWVTNLPPNTRASTLKDLISKYVRTISVKIVVNDTVSSLYGFGHVEMPSLKHAHTAIAKLNNTEFNGNIIKMEIVDFDNILALGSKINHINATPQHEERNERESRNETQGSSTRSTLSTPEKRSHLDNACSVLTFDLIKSERNRQRTRMQEREDRERDRKNEMEERRLREIARKQRQEASRILRENNKLRDMRDEFERQKAEFDSQSRATLSATFFPPLSFQQLLRPPPPMPRLDEITSELSVIPKTSAFATYCETSRQLMDATSPDYSNNYQLNNNTNNIGGNYYQNENTWMGADNIIHNPYSQTVSSNGREWLEIHTKYPPPPLPYNYVPSNAPNMQYSIYNAPSTITSSGQWPDLNNNINNITYNDNNYQLPNVYPYAEQSTNPINNSYNPNERNQPNSIDYNRQLPNFCANFNTNEQVNGEGNSNSFYY